MMIYGRGERVMDTYFYYFIIYKNNLFAVYVTAVT
jgi:hypothetical protein